MSHISKDLTRIPLEQRGGTLLGYTRGVSFTGDYADAARTFHEEPGF